MSRDNASSFGALGMMLVKGVLGYILVRLGKSQSGLEVRSFSKPYLGTSLVIVHFEFRKKDNCPYNI